MLVAVSRSHWNSRGRRHGKSSPYRSKIETNLPQPLCEQFSTPIPPPTPKGGGRAEVEQSRVGRKVALRRRRRHWRLGPSVFSVRRQRASGVDLPSTCARVSSFFNTTPTHTVPFGYSTHRYARSFLYSPPTPSVRRGSVYVTPPPPPPPKETHN